MKKVMDYLLEKLDRHVEKTRNIMVTALKLDNPFKGEKFIKILQVN
ncbi:hypothetical protein CV093_15965 [Oceanobacillus sp. 143]|nr:hypothetical protein CV093_15965 [Oceanobacillus sp. 143]